MPRSRGVLPLFSALALSWLSMMPAHADEKPAENARNSANLQRDADWTIIIRPAQTDVVTFHPAFPDASAAAASGSVAALRPLSGPDAPIAASFGQVATPGIAPPSAEETGVRLSYVEAYNSIPFSRAEYEANPGYRHEAAMELMFGQMRPTTIVKQTVPYFSRYPDFIRYRSGVYPYAIPYGPQQVDFRYFNGYSTYAR